MEGREEERGRDEDANLNKVHRWGWGWGVATGGIKQLGGPPFFMRHNGS